MTATTLLSLILFMLTKESFTKSATEPKTYSVKKIAGPVAISGKGDDPRWKNAHQLADFSYPWEKKNPHPTKFKALHDDAWLYCLFEVSDDHVILSKANGKSAVAYSSRAEIFLRSDYRLDPYYCLEIDPLGRVMDYQANYYRKFNLEWSWPTGQLFVKTARTKGGYSVELALGKSSLQALGLLKNNSLQAGLFRADCVTEGNKNENFKWASWVKPDSKTPDFHIPSSFGTLLLED